MNVFEETLLYFSALLNDDLSLILSIAFGGAIGAYARYCIATFFVRHKLIYLPWGTICVNLLGSFFIGLGTSFFLLYPTSISNDGVIFTFVGLLGAFTTFSTFANDSFILWINGGRLKAIMNIFVNIFFGLGLAFIGFLLPLL